MDCFYNSYGLFLENRHCFYTAVYCFYSIDGLFLRGERIISAQRTDCFSVQTDGFCTTEGVVSTPFVGLFLPHRPTVSTQQTGLCLHNRRIISTAQTDCFYTTDGIVYTALTDYFYNTDGLFLHNRRLALQEKEAQCNKCPGKRR